VNDWAGETVSETKSACAGVNGSIAGATWRIVLVCHVIVSVSDDRGRVSYRPDDIAGPLGFVTWFKIETGRQIGKCQYSINWTRRLGTSD
jgi:hypothetical protein